MEASMLLRRTVFAALFAACVMPALAAPLPQNGGGITVLAAASLTDALSEIGRNYEAASRKHVTLSFAGSMILAKQIEATSGADMFISADEESMDYVDSKGLITKPTRTDLLGNALVLIAPAD